ncbi:MAG: TetR/AcrR family transcriptional regulator [Haloplanus sp.]
MGTEEESSETHDAIMEATYRALCEHGYAALTMQDIADEFDKSRSLLHYHYDTKEDLLLAFLDHLIGWIGDRLSESDTEEPLERLEEFIEKFVIDPSEEGRRTFALALSELRIQAAHKEAFREKLAAHYRENVAAITTIIEDGVEEGAFRPVDPEVTGEMIYTSLVGARMYQVTLGADHATRRMQESLAEFVVSDLLTAEASVSRA